MVSSARESTPNFKATMRYPASETAEKHTRILDESSRLFRERGFEGVSVSEIMKATGLTHGPFYNHFASRDALVQKSFEHCATESLRIMDAAFATPEGGKAYVDGYLSTRHRDAPGKGCLMAALGAESAREPQVRGAFSRLVAGVADRLANYFPSTSSAAAHERSLVLLSAMVGAQVLARAVDDEKLSVEILEAVRNSVKR